MPSDVRFHQTSAVNDMDDRIHTPYHPPSPVHTQHKYLNFSQVANYLLSYQLKATNARTPQWILQQPMMKEICFDRLNTLRTSNN